MSTGSYCLLLSLVPTEVWSLPVCFEGHWPIPLKKPLSLYVKPAITFQSFSYSYTTTQVQPILFPAWYKGFLITQNVNDLSKCHRWLADQGFVGIKLKHTTYLSNHSWLSVNAEGKLSTAHYCYTLSSTVFRSSWIHNGVFFGGGIHVVRQRDFRRTYRCQNCHLQVQLHLFWGGGGGGDLGLYLSGLLSLEKWKLWRVKYRSCYRTGRGAVWDNGIRIISTRRQILLSYLLWHLQGSCHPGMWPQLL